MLPLRVGIGFATYTFFTSYVPNVLPTNFYKLYVTETQIGSTNRKAYFVGVEAWTQPPLIITSDISYLPY